MTQTKPDRREAEAPSEIRTVEGRVGALAEVEPRQDPLVPLSTRVPQSLRKKLRVTALQNDRDVQDVVAEALESWVSRHERG